MAIQDSFNLSNALSSQAYAYKCWYNYNYGNNTMGISAQDMGEITQTWNSELHNWQATAMDDENAYEIEDDDFSTAKKNGENQAKDATGLEDGNGGGRWTRAAVDAAGAGLGVAANLGAGFMKAGGEAIAKGVGQEVGKEALKEGVKGGLKNGASEAGKKATQAKGSWSIAAPLSLALATLYQAKKPNKDEKEACDALQDEMINSQNALYSAQDDMSAAGDEITALSDEAQTYNEDANENIEEQKSEYDTYKASYDVLMEKINAGEPLTESEQELFKELVPLMQELGVGIQTTQEETTEVAEDIYDEMGTYQTDYDNAASTVGEVQGVTDYAESFDESTRTTCYVEAASQTLNAASGTKAGIQAGISAAASFGFNAWAWACAAMGAAAGVMSGLGAAEQFKWAGEVGTEVDMRKDTQGINSTTNDIYDESIEGYEGAMVGVEEMELEMPEDMENPEEVLEQLGEESSEALTKATTQGVEEDSGNGTGSGLAAGIPTDNQDGKGAGGSFGSATGGTRTAGGNGTGGSAGGVNPNEKDKEEK